MISTEIVAAYAPLFKDYTLDFDHVGADLMYIPRFTKETLLLLCTEIIEKLKEEKTLLTLKSPIIILGDIHGNIRDLLRLFAYSGPPDSNRYLFLGDYVDRGEMSVEVITLLFALKLSFPESFFLIRGNHEFIDINTKYGFKEQVTQMYDEEVFNAFNEAFCYLPIAATIDDTIFVVHGGISPCVNFLDQIQEIKRPIYSYKDSRIVEDLVWSDPFLSNSLYSPSPRGFGCYFGRDALMIFLQSTGMKVIVRGHQCVPRGIEKQCNDCLYTVFSSSNYTPNLPNKAGVIKVADGSIKCYNFDQIQRLKMKDATYKDFEIGKPMIPKCGRMSIIQSNQSIGTVKKRLPTIAIKQTQGAITPVPIRLTTRYPRPKILSVEPHGRRTPSLPIGRCPTPPSSVMMNFQNQEISSARPVLTQSMVSIEPTCS